MINDLLYLHHHQNLKITVQPFTAGTDNLTEILVTIVTDFENTVLQTLEVLEWNCCVVGQENTFLNIY